MDTLFIHHRINTISDLQNVPIDCGIEFDVRDSAGEIIVTHDPFTTGPKFEDFIKEFKHKFMVVNIKSERIEEPIIKLLKDHDIENYFLLDCGFPMIYGLSNMGHDKLSLRFSEFEGLYTIKKMAGKVKWVWVDCFTKFILDRETSVELKQMGYKICIVGPDLQSQPEKIEEYRDYMKFNNIIFDAICTKGYNSQRWKS